MASSTHSAFEEKGEIVSQHSESIWCSLLHYLLNIEGAGGALRDLESLLTGSQSNGCLLLAEVFLSGKFVWDSSESTFSLGWWDLQYVLLTAQNAWNVNLLMLQKFAICFPFSRTPRSASLPEQHCLCFHPMKCCPPRWLPAGLSPFPAPSAKRPGSAHIPRSGAGGRAQAERSFPCGLTLSAPFLQKGTHLEWRMRNKTKIS